MNSDVDASPLHPVVRLDQELIPTIGFELGGAAR